MRHYYSTIDENVLTFTDIEKDNNKFEFISFYFERPNDTGFDFADGKLINGNIFSNQICKSYGFLENELMQMQEYIKNNSSLIWEIAKESKGE